MAVYLIRHGQSTVNAANQEANYSGLVYHEEQYWDAPLTDMGVSQAREAGKRFSSADKGQGNAETVLKKPDIILVSTLKRTMQTASIVFEEFRNCPKTRWIASDVIREAVQEHPWRSCSERKPCNYRSSLTESKAREEFPHISFEETYCSDADLFPELESLEQLDARCEEFLRLVRRIQKEERKPTIAVVAHYVFFRRLFEAYKHGGEELRMKNCQIHLVSEDGFKDV